MSPSDSIERAHEHHREGRLSEAIACYRQVVESDPSCHAAWYAMGCVWDVQHHDATAMECYQRAAELRPDHAESQHNLGKVLHNLGLVDEAVCRFRIAVGLGLGFLPRSAIATVIPGAPSADNRAVLEARRNFMQTHVAPADRSRRYARAPLKGRRLRVGYVSSFFQSPNWMKPVWALIREHDRDRFEIHLFSQTPAARCPGAERLHVDDRFHDLSGLAHDAIEREMEQAELDLLVDLNGYSCLRLLPMIASRPAPILVGWFNFYGTSGSDAWDCLVGDSDVIPATEECFYVEKILRVPGCYLAFRVNHPAPEVAAPPTLTEKVFTFGSFASSYKMTPPVIEAWSSILKRAPRTRLLLKNASLGSEPNREFLLRRFERHGVARERIRLEGPAPHFEFLSAYSRVDVALDTFPYNGGTTTEEALWQGVPVLTFVGDRWASRQGASILRAAGLPEFVAPDVDAFVDRAVALGTGLEKPRRLAGLRRRMRSDLERSVLCDTARLARSMEGMYFEMWNEWWARR